MEPEQTITEAAPSRGDRCALRAGHDGPHRTAVFRIVSIDGSFAGGEPQRERFVVEWVDQS